MVAAPAELIRQFVAGDYRRVVAAVGWATGAPDRAEDAVQEALVKVLVDGHRPDRLAAWVTVVATNLVRSALRRQSTESRAVERLQGTHAPDPAETVSDEVTLREVVASLPDRQREIVLLHYYLDLQVAEIATALEISDGTVKTQLHRARSSIARALGVEEESA